MVVAPERSAVPRWLPWTAVVICVLGLGVSIYLTIEHFNSQIGFACPATTTVDCVKVTTSPESTVFGIPVAVLGLAFFVPALAVNLPAVWRMAIPALRWIRMAGSTIGIGFVLYLVYAELFDINAICLWCTAVHVLTFALFAITAVGMTYPVGEGAYEQ